MVHDPGQFFPLYCNVWRRGGSGQPGDGFVVVRPALAQGIERAVAHHFQKPGEWTALLGFVAAAVNQLAQGVLHHGCGILVTAQQLDGQREA